MTPPLFLIDPLPDDELVVLAGHEGRHAATVRRITVGERVSLGDGRGAVRDGTVAEVGRERLVVRCGPARTSPPPQPRLVVVQALAKGDRGELAVELLTEVGADEIVPWAAARSIVQWHGERGERSKQRWASTAREAAKQSRRAWVPQVTELRTTAQVAGRIEAASALVLHEDATVPLTDTLSAGIPPASGDLLVVVGPEGGITDDERARFEAAGARSVRLGADVLRTSTAGAAACVALSVALHRW